MGKTVWVNSAPLMAIALLTSVSACGTASCPTMLVMTTLSLDFSRLEIPRSDLAYTLHCPELGSCVYDETQAAAVYAADAEYPVNIIPSVRSIRIVVVQKSTSQTVADIDADLEWNPPQNPKGCQAASNAEVRI